MAEGSEKRFQEAMDKIFRAPPKSKPTSESGVQLSRGKKRQDISAAFASVDPKSRGRAVQKINSFATRGSEEAPPCRPWDRGDLFTRMSTFKSMTWFAKPKAISAVNCARRGWINVDMDTIACEACGSRMLFSTPPSWSQQQIDKAALVFSLKLDSGHKLLCPWIDNTCDEKLADFPPTATALLVDQYKLRHSVLAQLASLPVISPKAIDCSRSLQLENFLRESLTMERDESTGTPQEEAIRSEPTLVSTFTYYQAQKLISLCGWELRRLPYLVDSKDKLNQSGEVSNLADKSLLSGKNQTITVYSSCNDKTCESQLDEDCQGSEEVKVDPNAVVLECRLCGACIGLWDFSMVRRPMEFLRVSGYTQVNDDRDDVGRVAASGNTMLDRRPPSFSLTIAGGPPPATHNYKAKISLPIIGRNLRAWFIAESELKDDLAIKSSSGLGKNPELLAGANTEEGTSVVITENSQFAAQVSGNPTEMAVNAENVDTVDPAVTGHCMVSDRKEKGGLSGKELQDLSLDRAREFDPFRLHRCFCPWITSNGGSPPGWEQTLSALQRHEDSSSPLPTNAPSSFIKVDDPVASVQKLFGSPPAKRKKLVRPS